VVGQRQQQQHDDHDDDHHRRRHRLRLRGSRSIGALLVIRVLLMANGVILVAIGALYALYGSRPAGLVVGGLLVALGLGLWACVPLTDPYRR
jgi:hypothetical protein